MSARGRRPVAVVTIARDRRAHLDRQRRWLREHSPGVSHIIVDMGGETIAGDERTTIIDHPVADGSPLPLAAARNVGAGNANADVLVFLDVDCLPTSDLVATYHRRVTRFGSIWSGPVGYLPPADDIERWTSDALRGIADFHEGRPQPGQDPALAPSPDLFWSLSFAVSADDFASIGGFDESFAGYGGEDTDFARTAVASGLDLWFDGRAVAFHQHHSISSPPFEHLDDIVENATRFRDKWGEWPMVGWLGAFADEGLIDWTPDATEIVSAAGARST